jgi:hypothetical protein
VKNDLRDLLVHRRFDEVVGLAARKKRVLGSLVSLTFDPDPLIVRRAIEAMGMAAARIVAADPDYVKNHLRRLHWLISDESGGVCWHAPEAMAEIVHRCPPMFADYASIVVSLLRTMEAEDLVRFRAGILWGIGRLAERVGAQAQELVPTIAGCLEDPDSQVRGMSVWCLSRLGRSDQLAGRSDLLADEGEVVLYSDGELARLSVGEMVRQIMAS